MTPPARTEDYLAALTLLEGVTNGVDVVVPGHGSIGAAEQVRARIEQDWAYVRALRDDRVASDPRLSAPYGRDWLPGVHEGQRQRLANGANATRRALSDRCATQ